MARNLYKRGRFYYYDFTFEGKRYNASTGCEYKSQALIVLRKELAEVLDGKIKPKKRKHTSFEELSERFIEWSKNHRKGTYNRDIHSLKQLIHQRQTEQPRQLTSILLSSYYSLYMLLRSCKTITLMPPHCRACHSICQQFFRRHPLRLLVGERQAGELGDALHLVARDPGHAGNASPDCSAGTCCGSG